MSKAEELIPIQDRKDAGSYDYWNNEELFTKKDLETYFKSRLDKVTDKDIKNVRFDIDREEVNYENVSLASGKALIALLKTGVI